MRKGNKPKKKIVDGIIYSWMKTDHYHCRRCNAPMTFIMRVGWRPGVGVCSLGICESCFMLLIEKEYGRPRWLRWLTWFL